MKRSAFHVISVIIFIVLTQIDLIVQAGPTALQTDLKDLEVGEQWIYGDLEKGIALAKESGKPLFVLFR